MHYKAFYFVCFSAFDAMACMIVIIIVIYCYYYYYLGTDYSKLLLCRLLLSIAPLSNEIRPVSSCSPPHLGPAIPEVCDGFHDYTSLNVSADLPTHYCHHVRLICILETKTQPHYAATSRQCMYDEINFWTC